MIKRRRPTTMFGAFTGAAALFLGLIAVSCAGGFDAVRTSPGLYPNFQYSVTDYVNRCDPNDPTEVAVSAPEGASISIDGQQAQTGNFNTVVDQQENEAFTIVVTRQEGTTTHYVRCLPRNFPEWEAAKNGATQAEFYSTVIINGFEPTNVPVIFDTNGVPVWWTQPQFTFLSTPFSNGNLAIMGIGGGLTERRLDGSAARTLNTSGAPSDFHDVLLLPNGNYMMATFEVRECDLTSWGAGQQEECVFHDFQELTPSGDVVWNWRPEDDIPVNETPGRWRSERDPQFGYYDPWHYNSVEWTGDGIIVSFRHLDAIYKIGYQSKNVVWKLGGSTRGDGTSLQFRNDSIGSFSGQHDARLLPGGAVSLFDNQSRTGRSPRSVAYQINEGARTATLLNRVIDSIAPNSGCCGSTRLLPNGNWVSGWGGTPWISENEADGDQVFRLDANFVYRAIPILPGFYTRDQLRAGMDAQYDGSVFAPGSSSALVDESLDPEHIAFRLGVPVSAVTGE